MQESYGEGPASHTGPESCAGVCEGTGEALTGDVQAGYGAAKSFHLQDADAVVTGGRPHTPCRYREMRGGPARSKTPSMYGHTSRENRESPGSPAGDGTAGRVGKSMDARRR
jgi:hypothetical protein